MPASSWRLRRRCRFRRTCGGTILRRQTRRWPTCARGASRARPCSSRRSAFALTRTAVERKGRERREGIHSLFCVLCGLCVQSWKLAPVEWPGVSMTELESAVAACLQELGITYTRHEHPPVATVESAQPHWAGIDATHCKNLFLR